MAGSVQEEVQGQGALRLLVARVFLLGIGVVGVGTRRVLLRRWLQPPLATAARKAKRGDQRQGEREGQGGARHDRLRNVELA